MAVPNLDWQQQPDLLCSNIVSPYREADRFRSISVQPGKNYRSTQRKTLPLRSFRDCFGCDSQRGQL